MRDRREYGEGTYLDVSMPFGGYVGGRALCSDGKVRALKRISETADTFFSIPAQVRVEGKTVTGYVTLESVKGYQTPAQGDPAVVKFVAESYRKNAYLLPPGKYREHDEAVHRGV